MPSWRGSTNGGPCRASENFIVSCRLSALTTRLVTNCGNCRIDRVVARKDEGVTRSVNAEPSAALLSPPFFLLIQRRVLMDLKLDEGLKALLEQGKDKGYLTYSQVNDYLPDDAVNPEKL